jgi:hypothetical protein
MQKQNLVNKKVIVKLKYWGAFRFLKFSNQQYKVPSMGKFMVGVSKRTN